MPRRSFAFGLAATILLTLAALTSLGLAVAQQPENSPKTPAGDNQPTQPATQPNVQPPKVSVRGLRVVSAPPKGDNDMRPFYMWEGVTLVLLVEVPEGGLIAFDREASKISRFVDDKGASLLGRQQMRNGFAGMFEKFSKDGKAAIIEVQGENVPSAGAQQLALKGTLVFTQARGKQTVRAEKVELKDKAEFTLGDLKFDVRSPGKPKWGNNALEFRLHTKNSTEGIAKLKFLNADGKEIKHQEAGYMKSFNDTELMYQLVESAEVVTIEAEMWTERKKIEIPIDLTTGLGF